MEKGSVDYSDIVKQTRATADANTAYAKSFKGRLDAVLALISEKSKTGVSSIRIPYYDGDLIPLLKSHFEVHTRYFLNVEPRQIEEYIISWETKK